MVTASPRTAERLEARRGLAALAFLLACIGLGYFLGETYISRLPQHAGYFLVAVHDSVAVPMPRRPRRTVFIVVDGLRRDAAEKMAATRLLLSSGQCRVSDQGSFTVSRPMYALLSTGLEVDRSGSRNNDLTLPLAAESIWQVARANGLSVFGSSHLRWFQQLFPEGFDRFTTQPKHSANVFDAGDLADINLFHPLYVDEMGHEHGATSPEYGAAVQRVDAEIEGFLRRVDLTKDVVVLTADHGHRDAGGHGGAQPDVKNVLLCFAGAGVARRTDRAPFDARTTAPALAVLLGLPFPKHIRAGDDALDDIWTVVASDDANETYLADRRSAVARFRAENGAVLTRWLGSEPGTWPRLYAREASAQNVRLWIVGVALLVGLGASFFKRKMRPGEIASTSFWLASAGVLAWAAHHAVLGDFDFTVVNLRERFVPRAALVSLVASLLAIGLHAAFIRRDRLLGNFLTLASLLVGANLGHIVVYRWPMGFPLPSQAARYFPFMGAIGLACFAAVGVVVLLAEWRRSRRA